MALNKLILDTNKVTAFYSKTPIIRQGDANEVLPILLGRGFSTVDLTKVSDIRFYAEKSGNKIVDMSKSTDSAAFPVANEHGYLEIILPGQLYTTHGDINVAYVQITTGDVKESTSTFQFRVLPFKGSADDNDNYIPEAANIVDDIKSKDDAAQTVLEHIRDKGTEADQIVAGAQGKIDGAVKQATDAADTANTAATNADKARDDFNQVKTDTLAAKDAAITAAGKATDATGKADTATAAANAATDKANASSTKADTSASNADAATQAAKDFITDAPNNPAFKGPQGERGEQGPKGDKGDKGDVGAGLSVAGTVAAESDLPKDAAEGTAYFIGTDMYIKTADGWKNVGNVKGPQGDQGIGIIHSDEDVMTGAATDEPDGTLLIDGHYDLYQAASGKWALKGNVQGAKGDKGDQGIQGPQGEQGPKGDTGATGPVGPKGDQGPKGDTGTGIELKGTVSSADKLPASGNAEGDTYTVAGVLYVWQDGKWTESGPIRGEKGEKGDTGSQGPKGDTGLTGPQGDPGKSAYQVWLDAGNKGTEAEYLASLKGPKGDTGATGAVGPQGAKGDTGPQGATGPQGPKGDTPSLDGYAKTTDVTAADTQIKKDMQAAIDAKIVLVADEATAKANSAKNANILYVYPES